MDNIHTDDTVHQEMLPNYCIIFGASDITTRKTCLL